METLLLIVCNALFYSFLYYTLYSFEFLASLSSSWLLLGIALIIVLPSIILLYILKKDRIKYFLFSSIWTIIITFLFFKFGDKILNFFGFKSGLTNFTLYLYKYLFMFSPFLSVFLVSLHKAFAQKKQLFFIIAFKYIFPIIIGFISMHFVEFSRLLWILAITDLFTTLFSVYYSAKKH